MACFLTILDYRDELFDEQIDFAYGLTQDYIWKVARVDFNTIVKHLNEYEGGALGVLDAKKQMEQANQKLYKIRGTFEEKSLQPLSKLLETRAEGWTECRGFVQAAYDFLKYLEAEANALGLLPNSDPDSDSEPGTDSTTVDEPADQ